MSHGTGTTKKKAKNPPKGPGIRKSALGTYAEMLNWEQRVKNEEKGSNEWTEVWGDIYKPRSEGDSDEKELLRNIEQATKELKELKETRTDIWTVEDKLSSKQFRRRATANDLGGPAQPI